MKTTILLADDHQLMREGLRGMLELEPDLRVVAEASDGRSAVKLAQELKPDVVLMDIGMPDLNGIDATKQIVAALPATRVIALSMHADRHFVAGMLAAGARGYLLKDDAFEEVAAGVRAVVAGRTYLSPTIADLVVQEYAQQTAPQMLPESPLTDRERQIVQLLAEGKTTKDVAGILHISPKTVETHRQHAMEKLDIQSLAELTKYAIRVGLTSLDG